MFESIGIEIIGQIFTLLLLLGLGFFFGHRRDIRHRSRLIHRRKTVLHVATSDIKTFPGGCDPTGPTPKLLVSQVVIANDYLKGFLASLRQLVGGEMKSYHSLLFRAREEALLQILEEASHDGYDAVCNLRIDTADVGGGSGRKGMVMVGILASATAYRRSA